MELLSLILAVAAGLGALWGWRRCKALETRLDTQRSAHYRLMDEMRRETERLQEELRRVKIELYRGRNGGTVFTPEMTIEEAMALHPGVADVLAAFHIGGCASCAAGPGDTLQAAASQRGVDLSLLLQALNALTDGNQVESVLESLQRRPNVVFFS